MRTLHKLYFLVPFIFLYSIKSYGNHNQDSSIPKTKNSPEIPVEQIYVHMNTTFFLPGESLFFKVYCINSSTGTLSNLSKIVYVEVINEELNPVFKQKIKLEKGIGQGDYFIPASLSSGNYKLIAYTQLIKNKGIKYVFQHDISIVNPYQSDQKKLFLQKEEYLDGDNNQEITTNNSQNNLSNDIAVSNPPLTSPKTTIQKGNAKEVALNNNISSDSENSSGLDEVFYIELINEDQNTVFKKKIKIEDGIGQEDYFIPSNIPSGYYKLIIHAQSSESKIIKPTIQQDIASVNPFQGNRTKISPQKSTLEKDIPQQIISTNNYNKTSNTKPISNKNTLLTISLSDSIYNKRAQAIIKLKSSNQDIQNGNYSISVRKIDEFPILPKKTFQHVQPKFERISKEIFWDDHTLIPELRGELIQGRIIIKNNTEQQLHNETVAISIPGKSYETKLVKTDKNGFFWFSKEDNHYQQDQAFLQVLGTNRDQYRIELDLNSNFNVPYDSISFGSFYLQPEMEKNLIERSVKNQIKNGFFSAKRDTIIVESKRFSPLDGMYDEEYTLDDYTRFPTVSETIVEIVNSLWVGKDGLGNKSLKVRLSEETIKIDKALVSLVIVDGLILQDHEKLLAYPAAKIKKMSLIKHKFILGVKSFLGVVEITTFDGDFYDTITDNYIYQKKLFNPLENKKYFKQQYTDSLKYKTDRIPDFRDQLLWEPNQTLKNETTTIPFFTSDNEGVYEINIEGFTKTGKPVSVKKNFKVL